MKKQGWLRNDQGEAQSASDYGADNDARTHDWIEDKTGSNALGHVGAVLAGLGAAPVGGALAVGGAVAQGYDTACDAVGTAADFVGLGPKVNLLSYLRAKQALRKHAGDDSPFGHCAA